MDASLETLVIAGYAFACSLSIPRPGPAGKITDQELIGLAVAQAVTGLASDRQSLRMVRRLLPTLISCANYPGRAKESDFAPEAAYGYGPSRSLVVWGMRLVVMCDRKGVPVGYDLVGPKTRQERETALRLAAPSPARPMSIIAQVAGSGTGNARKAWVLPFASM